MLPAFAGAGIAAVLVVECGCKGGERERFEKFGEREDDGVLVVGF